MTPRERLFARLTGQPVDRTPNLAIIMLFAARYIERPYSEFCRDHRVMAEANLRCAEDFGLDILSTMSDAYYEVYDFGAQVEFPYDNLPICRELLLKETSDLARLKPFDPWQSTRIRERMRAIEWYKREAGDRYPALGWVEGPIAEMADLRGLTETLVDFYEEPAFVEDTFTFLVEQEIRCALAQIEAGADIMGIGDAAASLLSPESYRTVVLPFEKKMVQAIHDQGIPVKLHICGNVTHLLDDIWQTGADIIDLDWMVDIPTALTRWPAGILANGNFDPVAIMLQGTPDDVRRETRRNAREVGERGCVSPGCEVPRDTPYANLRAMQEALV